MCESEEEVNGWHLLKLVTETPATKIIMHVASDQSFATVIGACASCRLQTLYACVHAIHQLLCRKESPTTVIFKLMIVFRD